MRSSALASTYVCLPCLLSSLSHPTRSTIATRSHITRVSTRRCGSSLTKNSRHGGTVLAGVDEKSTSRQSSHTRSASRLILKPKEQSAIGSLHSAHKRMQQNLPQIVRDQDDATRLPADKFIDSARTVEDNTLKPYIDAVEKVYKGKTWGELTAGLEKIAAHRRSTNHFVNNGAVIDILHKLGVIKLSKKKRNKVLNTSPTEATETEVALEEEQPECDSSKSEKPQSAKRMRERRKQTKELISKVFGSVARRVPSTGPPVISKIHSKTSDETRSTAPDARYGAVLSLPKQGKQIEAELIAQQAVESETELTVPRLSFDLSRVLFNPGVYQLRDPRSRVYNFDPYLESIMPVSEFNFEALNPYITSSQDNTLRDISQKHGKKYIGSSSSMTGAMSHFHFLLSSWRPIDSSILSQKFKGDLTSFTQITRAPASIYLRWRDGVYAVDADKEYDSPNILMMQGKSMEKLLTMEKAEFEKYRKPKAGEAAPTIDSDPEAYHYSTVGDFLLRSQLDAYDPRLPGTGMFDLKTRAVAGIRMMMDDHETGMGYQIKDRFGLWESFDREYYDMIRAAFLKYSLQVRMGRMDGIFVAYHNISRIFGFQYIPLNELDMALHGQADTTLGNREYKLTIKLMNEIFDNATKKFPGRSLRIMFETREPTKTHPNGIMNIFAEPLHDAEIDRVQKAAKAKVEAYEQKLSAGIDPKSEDQGYQTLEEKLTASTLEDTAPDTEFLESILGVTQADEIIPSEEGEVASWSLSIVNEVNGHSVIRPKDLSAEDRWVVHYNLEAQPNPEKAFSRYTVTRKRREGALSMELRRMGRDFFAQKMRMLSVSGKEWREAQDAIDAEREPVVLYKPQPTPA